MRIVRGAWLAAVLGAVAAACSSSGGGSSGDGTDEGGVPHYDSGTADATQPSPGRDAGATEASTSAETGAEAGSSEDGSGNGEAGSDAGEGGPSEAGVDAASDAPNETSSGPEAGTDASPDAGSDAPSVVAPVCDGVIAPGEYGGAGNQASATSGQTWYMTWDATNLYVAIATANVDEGSILYIAVNPANGTPPAGGATSGAPYDATRVTTLPFAAQLVVYANDGYTEGRTASNGGWGSPDTGSVVLCDNAATQTREEVIPWSLIGGIPSAFGWTGYLAANAGANPQGYIYGQMPTDDPSGSPANNDSFTKYFNVPDATPGVGQPFANEN